MKADDPNTRTDSSSDLPEALHHARPASGLYTASGVSSSGRPHMTMPTSKRQGRSSFRRSGEELRLDVDGRYPQMTASGTIPISPVGGCMDCDLPATGSNIHRRHLVRRSRRHTIRLHDGRHQDVKRALGRRRSRLQRAGLKTAPDL